ncbi:hypothetical protein CAI16_12405 [Virgibacillus dokdonensis]|uniref:MFS transporter n=2 Tax=Virgibacillus dokdonensis TaxID=302167 RepID=A0A3E0WQD9_9BACI|nr:hypothetical protein CAI16_12405 [Virgibacillus dokdonensis]
MVINMSLGSYWEIINLKNYRRLWIAQMLSGFGNSLYFVSLMWLVWNGTKSTLHSGFFAILYDVPQLLLGLWIGVVINRFSLKHVMVFSDLIRALGVIIVITCYFLDLLTINVLYIAIFIEGFMLVINRPANNAILPQIVPKDKLETANATTQISNRLVNVSGYGLAGVIVATVGALFSIIFNAISFLVSAFLINKIDKVVSLNKKKNSLVMDFKEGFKYLKQEPAIIIIFSIGILMNVGGAPITVLGPAYAEKIVNAGATGYGVLQATWLVGIALGAFFIGYLNTKKLWVTLGLGFCLQGVAQLAFALSNHLYLSMFFILIHGCFMSVANIPLFSFLQRYVPREQLTHVFSILGTLVMVVNPLAFAASGFLAEHIGIRLSYVLGSLLPLVASILIILPPWLRKADKSMTKEEVSI